jgi:hypothetical protein
LPLEWWQWKIAREFGWTLDYIESLPLGRLHQYWQILDGEGKAQAQQAKSGAARRPARRRR